MIARHEASADIVGSRWGRHGGPMVTLGVYGSTNAPAVLQWTFPSDPNGKATVVPKTFTKASGIPTKFFYGADGMVDVPFGARSFLSYTGSGAAFPGEALFYDADYGTVTSRAKCNGFYSGAGLEGGILVFSALSGLSNTVTTTNDNGLYAAVLVNADLETATSRKLFGWTGNSGPVVADAHGNVFVGASLSGGTTSDALYAMTKAQVSAGEADHATIAAIDSGGTASIAAIAPSGAREGWALGIGFDPASDMYAAPYNEGTNAVVAGAAVVNPAISKTKTTAGLSAFTDDAGHPWLAVTTSTSGFYLELAPRP